MSTRQQKKTKQTLLTHKEDFKNIHIQIQEAQKDLKKKIYEQILKLDEQDKKQILRQKNRKRMLVFKNQIDSPYIQDEKDDLLVPVDGDLKVGTMTFMKNCASCHSLQGVDPKPTKGPSLGLIYNRKAGSNISFETYGLDLLKANFYWTSKNLYNFMGNTSSLLAKTSCKLATNPLKSQSDRADLIAFFKDFTTEMKFNLRLKQINRKGYDHYQTALYTHKQQRERGKMREQSDKNRQKII